MTYRYLEPKKWSLFDVVGTYSYGTNLALKVGLVPVETTSNTFHLFNFQSLKDNPGWRKGQLRDMSQYKPVNRNLPASTNNIKTIANKMAQKHYPEIHPVIKSTARKFSLYICQIIL